MKPTRFSLAVTILCAVALSAVNTVSAGTQPLESRSVAELQEPEPFSWTGFYIGGHLGGVWNNFDIGPFEDEVDVDHQFESVDSGPGPVFTNTGGPGFFGFDSEFFSFGGGLNGDSGFNVGTDDSFIGGGQLGYQHQFGNFVVGVEGDFSRLSPRRSESFEASSQQIFFLDERFDTDGDDDDDGPIFIEESLQANTNYTATRRAEIEWQGSVRARLGWASGRVHLYATGGAAFAQVKSTAIGTATTDFFFNEEIFVDSFPSIPFTNGAGTNGPNGFGFPIAFNQFPIGTVTDTNVSSKTEVLTGWTGGGGGEVALNHKVSVGVEYRHTDLGSHTFVYDSNGGPIFPGPTTVDFQSDQVTVRFNILLSHFFGR